MQYCALGAIKVASGLEPFGRANRSHDSLAAERALAAVLGSSDPDAPMYYNDSHDHTCTLAMFDAAIAAEEAKENDAA